MILGAIAPGFVEVAPLTPVESGRFSLSMLCCGDGVLSAEELAVLRTAHIDSSAYANLSRKLF